MKNLIIVFLLVFGIHSSKAQDVKYVETNGVKIYYETHGEGEPLLLLHGFTLSHNSWDHWVEDLSKNHQLIIPDLRGHGNSTNPSKIYTHQLSATDMYGLMDHLKIDKFQALGQSSGAMTLTHMATMDTTRIKSLILVAATSYFPKQSRPIMGGVTFEKWNTPRMNSIHVRGEEQIKMLVEQFNSFASSYDDMNFTPAFLSTIACPTLIIHGDRDSFFPVDIPLSSYKAIPESYLWIVPNEGHIPIGIYNRNSIWSSVLHVVIEDFFRGKWENE